MPETISPGKEPTTLAAALAEYIARQEPGSRLHSLGTTLLRAHGVNRDRRHAVLKHEDLARRLVKELGYANAEQWNGYIPPALIDPGGNDASCSIAIPGRPGEVRFRFSQTGRRGAGERVNDSRRRAVLLEISTEAWEREHPKPEPEESP